VRIVLRSALDQMSGYGHDGVGLAQALMHTGFDVHLTPSSVVPPIPYDIAQLLTKPSIPPVDRGMPPQFDVAIIYQPPMDLRAVPYRYVAQRLIGFTMYEWETLRWPGWEKLRPDLEATGYDALFVPDVISHQALDDPEVNPGIPVHVIRGGYSPEFWSKVEPRHRDWTGTFRYVMVGRLNRRKGVWHAVKAFGILKDRHGDAFDAELHLKTTTPEVVPPQVGERWPGIYVHLEWWSGEQVRNLYAQSHCYVAPSTGEGKNIPALEAATTGMAVIGTDYGGHAMWLDPAWSYPLRWTPKEYKEGRSAEPDVEHLVELMWQVYTDRAEARRKGELAARTLPGLMGWDSVVTNLVSTLTRVSPGGPPTGGAAVGPGGAPHAESGVAPHHLLQGAEEP
jgi:glycosyltransferase involved in cell wall biosynthesis